MIRFWDDIGLAGIIIGGLVILIYAISVVAIAIFNVSDDIAAYKEHKKQEGETL